MRSSVAMRVDAVAKYYMPVPATGDEVPIKRHGIFADSTLTTEHEPSQRQPLITRLRWSEKVMSTFEVTVRGGCSSRAMARDIAEAVKGRGDAFDTLTVVYQISDRARVDKQGTGIVDNCRRKFEEWVKHVEFFLQSC